MKKLPYSLRPASTNDFNFITATWVQSYRQREGLDYDTYNQFANEQIRQILNRAMTIVACDNEFKDQILGYVTFDLYLGQPVLHYVYVKALYREMGIAKELVKTCINKDYYFTFKTEPRHESQGKEINGHKGIYAPYLRHGEFYHGKDHTKGPSEQSTNPA